MANEFEGGVTRAREMVDELTGDTRSFIAQVSAQLEATVERNQQLRDRLMGQVQRLDALLDYQRGQLAAMDAAQAQIPSEESAQQPAAATPQVDLADADVPLSDRVLAAVETAPGRSATLDEIAERLSTAGDLEVSRRQVSTAVTNLVRRGDVARDDDIVTRLS